MTEQDIFNQMLQQHIKPYITQIDDEAYYPREFLSAVGKAGFFKSNFIQQKDVRCRELFLIEETAKFCMTSAFTLWCHLAALASFRLSSNPYIHSNLLPLFESGELLAGTGISNAIKYYAGLERVRLAAKRTEGGFTISGSLLNVSNLADDHWFVIMASLNEKQRIICSLPVHIDGLTLESKTNYIGLNGSATYACYFENVFILDKWVISDDADEFIPKVRPILALYQISLGIGVSQAAMESIVKSHMKNKEVKQQLKPQPTELINKLQIIRDKTYGYTRYEDLSRIGRDILSTRLDIAKLTPEVVHAEMLYSGGKAYLQGNDTFRRLRESYFLVNLSPTIMQLETLC